MSREVVLASEELRDPPESITKENIKVEDHSDTVDLTVDNIDYSVTITQEISTPCDDEEDVPSDFFDDFSNQDFMAGLDIVDAWDDDELNDKEKVKKLLASRAEKEHHKHKRSDLSKHSPIRYSNNDQRYRRSRDRARVSVERDHSFRFKNVRLRDQPREKEHEDSSLKDHRRDPEKTKRDIQKDKDKRAKDKEAQIISEKLKVVETGLVPPGMEMEVDLKQLNPAVVLKQPDKKPESARGNASDVRPERRSARVEKPAFVRRRRSRSISVERLRSGRYIGKEKRYSPHRRSRSHNRSFEKRVYPRSKSPYRRRSRSRSYHKRKTPERRLYLEERKRKPKYRELSPTIIRKLSRECSPILSASPLSNVSDRELWLREREHRKMERKTLNNLELDTGNRKRSKNDFLEELANKLKSDKKKKSFLKEIQERINGPSKPNYCVVPGPVPPPVTLPNHIPLEQMLLAQHTMNTPEFMPAPPQFFPQPIDPASQYDKQFFIGQPDLYRDPNIPVYPQQFVGNLGVPMGPPDAQLNPIMQSLQSPMNLSNFAIGKPNNVDILRAQKAAEVQKIKDEETIAKLFEDKKISLSDFLSVSAKHADPLRPVNVKKKVKVISQCQDAIKAICGGSKLGGRFFCRKTTRDTDKKEETKYQSALRKIPVVRFTFTTPSRGTEDKSALHNSLDKLLASLGLIERPPPPPPKPMLSPVVMEAPAFRPKQPHTPVKLPIKKYEPMLGAKYQMKMCQTDTWMCNICEIRNARKTTDQGIQCEFSKTVDSATQMTEEDSARFSSKILIKDNLKNQSFAHLTPAQILAAQGSSEESTKKDLFPAARAIPTPPIVSPEKQNIRSSLSKNDSFPHRSEYADRYQGNSMFDKPAYSRPNSFENAKNKFGNNNPNLGMQFSNSNDNRFRGNSDFGQRTPDGTFDFEPSVNSYGGRGNISSRRPRKRGKFLPGPYGGRNFM